MNTAALTNTTAYRIISMCVKTDLAVPFLH